MKLQNKFNETVFEYNSTDIKQVLLEAIKNKIDLTNLVLEHQNLSGMDLSNLDLSGSLFCCANLFDTNLTNSNISDCGFFGANLRYAKLNKVIANNTLFNEAMMSSVYLKESILTNSTFISTNLRLADLTDSIVSNSDFTETNFSEANLNNVDFSEAKICCYGNRKQLFSMQVDNLLIGYTSDILQIKEEKHLIEDWKKFDKKQIEKIGITSIWWDKWSKTIFNTIKLSFKE